MAAGGRENVEESSQDFSMNGLDIDAALGDPNADVALGDPNAQDKKDHNPEGHGPKLLHGPIRPSAEDVEKHNAVHVPYRTWCWVCVAVRRKEYPHSSNVGTHPERREATLPKFYMDY